MNYVTSDIHGCYETFKLLLKTINFSKDDTLYLLGDIIDRGPEPIKMMKLIMKTPNIKMLMGNHEDMMLTCLTSYDLHNNAIWANNGGFVTYDQYIELSDSEKKKIISFLKKLPLYFIFNDKIMVHAGINPNLINPNKSIEINMKKQSSEDLMWIRNDFLYLSTNLSNYTVIFGHTPTSHMQYDVPMKIWHNKDKIGIDCGCVFPNGQLGCICLDTMEEIYIPNQDFK